MENIVQPIKMPLKIKTNKLYINVNKLYSWIIICIILNLDESIVFLQREIGDAHQTAKLKSTLFTVKVRFSVLFPFVASYILPAVCFRHFTLSELLLYSYFHNFFFLSSLLLMTYVTLDFFALFANPM